MKDHLSVYLFSKFAGTLEHENGVLSFAYDKEYLKDPKSKPLSYLIPLSCEVFHNDKLIPFISNLLPDESVRAKIARILGISFDNTFALIKELGGDCAGAISFEQGEKNLPTPQIYKELSDNEAYEILANLSNNPLNLGFEGYRISGSGAQNKLVAKVENSKVFLPLKGTPSTHIIKPEIEGFLDSVLNEYFCMQLSSECDLNTAKSSILKLKDTLFYVTTRYDRVVENAEVKRLHQEDFCQLLGVDPSVKYESEGGPNLNQCFKLLRELELTAADIIQFLDKVIFNFIIGNGDAHAKNFSILYTNDGPRLAPSYDLLATVVYKQIKPRMAMKISNHKDFKFLTAKHFFYLAEEVQLSKRLVKAELTKVASKVLDKIDPLQAKLSEEYPSSIYQEISNGIKLRASRLTNL